MKRFNLNYRKGTLLRFERSDVHAFCFLENVFFEFALAFESLKVERFLRYVAVSIKVLGEVALAEVVLIDYSNHVYLWIAH